MPNATTITAPERFDLKTLPEGYVVIRKMTYVERLHRQDISLNIKASLNSKQRNSDVEFGAVQKAVTHWEFKTLIVDHNLEDETGRKLNLADPKDFALIGPEIGEEVGNLIDEFNQTNSQDLFRSDPESDQLSETV